MTDRQRQPSCIWTFRWANNNNSRTYSQARTSYCKLNGNLRIVKGYGCVSRRIAIRRTGLNGLRTNSAFVALKRNIVLSLPITMNVFASINTHIHTHTHTITSKFNNIILRISQVRLNLSTWLKTLLCVLHVFDQFTTTRARTVTAIALPFYSRKLNLTNKQKMTKEENLQCFLERIHCVLLTVITLSILNGF